MPVIIQPVPIIHPGVREDIATLFADEAQVIVHVTYRKVAGYGNYIRIWPTTYLVPQEGGNRSKLVHAENICYAPDWYCMPEGRTYRFTLIFTPLPKVCRLFHLWEDIDEPNGFIIRNIPRNDKDVYEVDLVM